MITSTQNQKIKQIRALQSQARARRKAGAFVVEGVRLAEEVFRSGWVTQLVLFSEGLNTRGTELVNAFATSGIPVEEVTPQVMRACSDTETPQGILLVLTIPELPIPEKAELILIPDGVRDPGNLGTILRTAAAAGTDFVLLPKGNADLFAPKVVRAAMGAHFRAPMRTLSWDQIKEVIDERALHVYLADARSGETYHRLKYQLPMALVVGGEAAGAGISARNLTEQLVHIPMAAKVESLNTAMATAIILFEVKKQREK